MKSKTIAHSKLNQYIGQAVRVYDEDGDVIASGVIRDAHFLPNDSGCLLTFEDGEDILLEGWECVYLTAELLRDAVERVEHLFDDDERFDAVRNGDFR